MAAGDTPITVVGNLVADPERGYRLPGRSESEFRIGNEVADYRDLGVTCRHRGAPGR